MAEPADRNAGDDLLQHVRRHRAHHVGIDVAWRDGVDGDAEARAFLGQRLGEAVDARLGRGVVDLAILAGLAVDAADIDDAAELGGAHAVEGQLAQVVAGAEVGIDHRIPHVASHACQRTVAGDAGIVHQDFDRPDIRDDLLERLLAGLEAADVELGHPDPGLLVECGCRFFVAGIVGDNNPALLLQRSADGRADSSCSARYQCDPCHRFLPADCS